MDTTFKAMVVEETAEGFARSIRTRRISELPPGSLLVRVKYSSLNYKDALSASGSRGVTKKYPHTPGIDAAGIVEASESKDFSVGDKVIVTSYDLGMNTSGGFGEYIRVPAEWAVPLPEKLTLKEAMILGTAGFTAGISALRLSELVKPESGEVIVSGATGGVGSVAVAILAGLGYKVAALSGKPSQAGYLSGLGASRMITRSEMEGSQERPLLNAQFAGGVDTVGGPILVNIIKSDPSLGSRHLLRKYRVRRPASVRISIYTQGHNSRGRQFAGLSHAPQKGALAKAFRRVEAEPDPKTLYRDGFRGSRREDG